MAIQDSSFKNIYGDVGSVLKATSSNILTMKISNCVFSHYSNGNPSFVTSYEDEAASLKSNVVAYSIRHFFF